MLMIVSSLRPNPSGKALGHISRLQCNWARGVLAAHDNPQIYQAREIEDPASV